MIKLISMTRARIVGLSISIVVTYTFYLSVLNISPDEDTSLCSKIDQDSLLIEGFVVNNKSTSGGVRWKPFHCSMYNYSRKEANKCMSEISKDKWNLISFVGDSRARHVYDWFIHFLDPSHDDHFHRISRTVMYDQWVDLPNIRTRVESKWSPLPGKSLKRVFKNWNERIDIAPTFINIHIGMWAANRRHNPKDHVEEIRKSLTEIKNLSLKVPIVWNLHALTVFGKSYPDERIKRMNDLLPKMDEATNELFKKYQSIKLGYSSKAIAEETKEHYLDGYHVSRQSIMHETQIILNMLCNRRMLINQDYCCTKK